MKGHGLAKTAHTKTLVPKVSPCYRDLFLPVVGQEDHLPFATCLLSAFKTAGCFSLSLLLALRVHNGLNVQSSLLLHYKVWGCAMGGSEVGK